jgi:transposase InsO family protein
MSAVCKCFDKSKSWYYDTLASSQRVLEYEQMIVNEVVKIRAIHQAYGIRKLWHELSNIGIEIGRDKLHRILRKRGLLLSRHYKKVRTSIPGIYDSGFENLIKGLPITRPNQAICADITYVHTTDGILYLSVLMDMFSRKILSFNISNNLQTDGALDCLNQALKNAPDLKGAIHHSDHGCQYCSYRYLKRLQANGLAISFTGQNHCYDNAKIERFFNTLKHEYLLRGVIKSKRLARELIKSAIHDYNNHRLHAGINYQVPAQVYNAA